ncbi:MAG: hypothetical protein ACYC9L_09095 [Sulfuricaulis sp.]
MADNKNPGIVIGTRPGEDWSGSGVLKHELGNIKDLGDRSAAA